MVGHIHSDDSCEDGEECCNCVQTTEGPCPAHRCSGGQYQGDHREGRSDNLYRRCDSEGERDETEYFETAHLDAVRSGDLR